MMILAEGVSEPKEIDKLWLHMFQNAPGPCAQMDQVGLDTVAFIEDNYVKERHLDTSLTTDWLRYNYVNQGKLGAKSDKGGLYPPPSSSKSANTRGTISTLPSIFFLDLGLGSNVKDITLAS